jgi:hypothetical protein
VLACDPPAQAVSAGDFDLDESVKSMLQRITGFVVVASFVAVAGCGAPVITADDVVVAPGQAGRFVVSLDRQFGKASVGGAEVEILVDGKRVGTATTDSNGVATIHAPVDGSSSTYAVRAKAGNEVAQGRGRIFNWNSSRTAVAIDVDDTISATDYGSLFMTDLDTTSPHVDHSPAAVQAMAPHYGIVYLSARPRWLHEKTKVWLDEHGFPPGPILHASRFEACWQQERYKRDMVNEFQQKFPNLLVGVGDKDVDDRAYGDNQMLGVILEKSPNGYRDHCVVLPDWQQIQEFFVENQNTLTDANRLQQMIHANNGQLRSHFEQNGYYSAAQPAESAANSPRAGTASSESRRAKSSATGRTKNRPAERGDWIYGYR